LINNPAHESHAEETKGCGPVDAFPGAKPTRDVPREDRALITDEVGGQISSQDFPEPLFQFLLVVNVHHKETQKYVHKPEQLDTHVSVAVPRILPKVPKKDPL
jgi:hypothetical protein